MGDKDIFEHCTKCGIFEKEIENIKKDVDEMKIDIKVSQKVYQEFELRFTKFETFITEKFSQLNEKFDDIISGMAKAKESKNGKIQSFITDFIYPALVGTALVYIAYKLQR